MTSFFSRVALVSLAFTFRLALGIEVTVHDPLEAFIALNDTRVTTIKMATDIRVTEELTTAAISLGQQPSQRVHVTRNLTFRGVVNSTSGKLPVMDLGRAFGRVTLGPDVWVTFERLVIVVDRNKAQTDGTGALWGGLDIVALAPDYDPTRQPVVFIKDAQFTEAICPPFSNFKEVFVSQLRSAEFPGAQQFVPLNDTYCTSSSDTTLLPSNQQGVHCYPQAAHIVDFATQQPAMGMQGGYAYIMHNTIVACEAVATEACAALYGPSACISTMRQQRNAAASAAAPSGKSSNKVPIILGVVLAVVGVSVLAVAGFVLARRYVPACGGGRHRRRRGRCGRRSKGSAADSTTSSTELFRSQGTSSGSTASNTTTSTSCGANSNSSDLTLGVMIGCGSFGRVYRGTWQGMDVAVKKILHSRAESLKIQRELTLSMALDHPHIVRSLHWVDVDHGVAPQTLGPSNPSTASDGTMPLHGSGYLFPSLNTSTVGGTRRTQRDLTLETWIVSELCDQGALSTAVYSGRFSPVANAAPDMAALLLRARDIAAGMQYLHARGICHGDLKNDNILLKTSADDPYSCVCKICDFGLSRALAEGRSHVTSRNYGTVTHMSPEILTTGQLRPSGDVWSFGVMLWEMATCARPYAGLTQGEIVARIVMDKVRLAFPSHTPAPLRQLAHACWDANPDVRPTFADICARLQAMLQDRLDAGALSRLSPVWERQQALAADAAAAASLAPITEGGRGGEQGLEGEDGEDGEGVLWGVEGNNAKGGDGGSNEGAGGQQPVHKSEGFVSISVVTSTPVAVGGGDQQGGPESEVRGDQAV